MLSTNSQVSNVVAVFDQLTGPVKLHTVSDAFSVIFYSFGMFNNYDSRNRDREGTSSFGENIFIAIQADQVPEFYKFSGYKKIVISHAERSSSKEGFQITSTIEITEGQVIGVNHMCPDVFELFIKQYGETIYPVLTGDKTLMNAIDLVSKKPATIFGPSDENMGKQEAEGSAEGMSVVVMVIAFEKLKYSPFELDAKGSARASGTPYEYSTQLSKK